MPTIRNVSGSDCTTAGRLVLAGGVLEVPAEAVYGYTQQTLWEPVDPDAQAAHDAGHAAYLDALQADGQQVPTSKPTAVKRGTKKES